MEVPRFWRNKNYMLNPNMHGYRPEPPVDQIPPSVKLTCIKYDGTPDSYAQREVQNYSKMIKNETEIKNEEPYINKNTETVQVKVSSGVIYQDAGVAV